MRFWGLSLSMGVTPTVAPGFHINIFEVKWETSSEDLMVLPPRSALSVGELREKYETSGRSLRFYYSAKTSTVYAYGPDRAIVTEDGFSPASINMLEVPDLARRVLLDGFADHLSRSGYKIEPRMGRYTAVQHEAHWKSTDGRVQLYKGFDINSIMWSDPRTNNLCFGLVVDLRWVTRDDTGATLKTAAIATAGLTLDVARAQSEILPNSSRINTEITRFHLEESILPFIQGNRLIQLGGGARFEIESTPLRVVMGAGE